jgi:hypothetical protein
MPENDLTYFEKIMTPKMRDFVRIVHAPVSGVQVLTDIDGDEDKFGLEFAGMITDTFDSEWEATDETFKVERLWDLYFAAES